MLLINTPCSWRLLHKVFESCKKFYSQLDVTGLNYVSRREEPLVLMTVEHAAFSSDGQWLATVSGGFFSKSL